MRRRVDRGALAANLDRLVALRGDLALGLPASAWAESLAGVDRELLLRAAIAAVRELLLPAWAQQRKSDTRPQWALETAETWLESRTAKAVSLAKAAAKGCTAARKDTFGYEHRVAEAARCIARAVGAPDASPIFDALAAVEEELLYRIAVKGEYHRAPAQRRAIVDVLRRVLLAPERVAKPKNAAPDGGTAVPYSPETHFELGMHIIHEKFGEVVVTSVGRTWMEVEAADGGKKRLAHRP